MSAYRSPLPYYLGAINAILDGASLEAACAVAPADAAPLLANLLNAWMQQVYFHAHPILRIESLDERRNAISDVPVFRRAQVQRFVASHWKDRAAYLKGLEDAKQKENP